MSEPLFSDLRPQQLRSIVEIRGHLRVITAECFLVYFYRPLVVTVCFFILPLQKKLKIDGTIFFIFRSTKYVVKKTTFLLCLMDNNKIHRGEKKIHQKNHGNKTVRE